MSKTSLFLTTNKGGKGHPELVWLCRPSGQDLSEMLNQVQHDYFVYHKSSLVVGELTELLTTVMAAFEAKCNFSSCFIAAIFPTIANSRGLVYFYGNTITT